MKLLDIKPIKTLLFRNPMKLEEGFFKNEIEMTVANAKKLSGKMKKNWKKNKTSWTLHDGENHIFTYNTKRKVLMTDMDKKKVTDMLNG